MKSAYAIILILAASGLQTACNSKAQKTDLIDSISNSQSEAPAEHWDMRAPDTAAMRKTLTCVEIVTTEGKMEVALFNTTPKHRDNFLKLIKQGYYHNVLFHRVINNFMIQTGDPDSKKAKPGDFLGQGGPGYTTPAEIIDTLHHFRGALSAARTSDDINPEKASSGSQFYIVTGEPQGSVKMKAAIRNQAVTKFLRNPDNLSYDLRMKNYQSTGNMAAMNVLLQELEVAVKPLMDSLYNAMPETVKQTYATWGGYPGLDGEYTIFGFLLSGYDVLDKIQHFETDGNNRPLKDVKIISARVLNQPK